ncbi:MAG: hypothetical protein N3B16_05375 [Candidatus Aminicenantes bacterium]|nr:hypothetical protein [Candidatus Aminicenantes bacterium]
MSWFDRFVQFLTKPPLPPFLLQITAHRLTGFRVKEEDRRENRYFISFLEPGLIEPSVEKSNLRAPDKLLTLIQQELKKIGGQKGALSLLLPESCFRVFLLLTESLPASSQERLALIRWRVKKLYPLLPEDFRFDYQSWRIDSGYKLLVVGAKETVIKEYEDLFSRAGWQVRLIGVPTIYLLALIKEKDFLLVNIEKDYLALLACFNGIPWLYRVKSFYFEKEGDLFQPGLAEIENTLHFIEDKEKREIKKIIIRWVAKTDDEPYLINSLERLGLEIKKLEAKGFLDLNEADQNLLAPLLGLLANQGI